MEGQTIVEKTPWRKRRTILGRGLTVIALCKIVLCVALAIGIAVIVSKSCSRDAPDSDAAEPLPFKPEALVWKSFRHKLLKKMTIGTRTAVIRPDAIGPSTKRTETITPNQGVVTNGAGRPDTVAPVTKRTETTEPNKNAVTNGAGQPNAVAPVADRTDTATPKQHAATNGTRQPDAIGPATKRTEAITPNQGVVTNGAGRPDTVAPVSKRTETPEPNKNAVTNGAGQPDAVTPAIDRTETAAPTQHTVTNAATQPHKITTTPKPKNIDDIFKYMDMKAEPCNDFYQYACGGFLNRIDVPVDKSSVSAFTRPEDELKKQLIDIFGNDKIDEPKSFQLAKALYKSCISPSKNSTEAMKLSLSNLLKIILVSHQSSSQPTFNWTTVLYRFHELGYSVNYFFDFDVDVDIQNSTAHAIYLDQAVLGDTTFYLQQSDDPIYNYYEQYIRHVAEALNVTENVKDLLNKAKDVQVKLANIANQAEKEQKKQRPRHVAHRRHKLKVFIESYPGLSWMKDYFKKVLSATINEVEIVIVRSHKYLQELEKLLKNTDNSTLISYIIWRALIDSEIYMRDEITDITLELKRIGVGVLPHQSRKQECVDVVLKKFPLVVSAMYAKRYDDYNAMKGINEFLEDYNKALAETLKEPGLHNTAMKQAAEKHANASVVFHPTKEEKEMLEDLYKDLILSEDDFFKNSLNLSRFASDYTLKKLRQITPESVWASSTMSIFKQARYSHAKNSLDVSALIMRPPYFSKDQSAFLNYGKIGFLMSRQFASAFDNNGRDYDQHGNIIRGVQHSTSDDEYSNFTACISDAYIAPITQNGYKQFLAKVDIEALSNEPFADLAGLKIAYSTYVKWMAKNEAAQNLNVNNLTPQKLFWISAAQTRCTEYDWISRKFYTQPEFNIIQWLSVVAMMSNTREWLDDFSCSQTSPMYGRRNCTIW